MLASLPIYRHPLTLEVSLVWVDIKVQIQETWGPNTPQRKFGLKLGPKLEDCFLKLRGVVFRVRTAEIWWEGEATLAPIH